MLGKGYFFHGEETFLVDEAVAQIKASLPQANTCYFTEAITLQNVIEASQTTGLFAQSTLIILKNPDFLKKALDKKAVDQWKKCLQAGVNSQTAIIVYVQGKVDMRKACATFLKKNYTTQQFMPFKDWEEEKFMQWVKQRCQQRNQQLTDDALNLFCQITGIDCRAAVSELETLAVLTAGKPTITLDDIKAACPQAKGSIYDLTESLKTRQYQACFKAFRQLKSAGEDPIKLMGLLIFNIRFYIQLVALKSQPLDSVAKQLGKHPFFIKQVLGPVVKHYKLDQLETIFAALAQLDVDIKSGKINAQSVFSQCPAIICL